MLCHFQEVQSPLVVNIRINSGAIPEDHWIQDPEIGGGRVIGEGCHFVDLASALVGSNPKTVSCIGTSKSHKSALLNDNVIINLSFRNGSIANTSARMQWDGAPSTLRIRSARRDMLHLDRKWSLCGLDPRTRTSRALESCPM